MAGGEDSVTCNSPKRNCTQLTLVVVEATARYSASVEERATVSCFFEHQDIGFLLRYKTKVVVEVQSSQFPAQSELEKP